MNLNFREVRQRRTKPVACLRQTAVKVGRGTPGITPWKTSGGVTSPASNYPEQVLWPHRATSEGPCFMADIIGLEEPSTPHTPGQQSVLLRTVPSPGLCSTPEISAGWKTKTPVTFRWTLHKPLKNSRASCPSNPWSLYLTQQCVSNPRGYPTLTNLFMCSKSKLWNVNSVDDCNYCGLCVEVHPGSWEPAKPTQMWITPQTCG